KLDGYYRKLISDFRFFADRYRFFNDGHGLPNGYQNQLVILLLDLEILLMDMD
ncbi:14555_t:CDS:1, partial [Cetraspora pellucida]